jgi:hypothetical protein
MMRRQLWRHSKLVEQRWQSPRVELSLKSKAIWRCSDLLRFGMNPRRAIWTAQETIGFLVVVVTLVDTNRDLVVLQEATGAVALNFRLKDYSLQVG